MTRRLFLLCLAFRSLGLLLPHTFFQPDEFFQAFEPAYAAAFGAGHLTWEWRDLPTNNSSTSLWLAALGDTPMQWWQEVVVQGRLRGWLWPGVFLGLYKLLAFCHLDHAPWITLAPRVVGVVIAAATDYNTYRLACKVVGTGYASGALLLSMTSLFHGHLLSRALSTSPETLLTVLALVYYPLPSLTKEIRVKPRSATYADMDYIEGREEQTTDLPILAAALAATSICIRPTMLVFWGYLHLETTLRRLCSSGVLPAVSLTAQTLAGGLTTVALSTAVDWFMVGRLTAPVLTFIHQNVVLNISSFYGATNVTYHLVQSLPIMLFPIWFWWAKGFLAALVPKSVLPRRLAALNTPPPLRALARTVSFAIAALSLSPHSEWRFLHPLLPVLLLFALPALQQSYKAAVGGSHHLSSCLRQYCRLPRGAWLLITLAPLIPYIYLNAFHGNAQVAVINNLSASHYGKVHSLVALMPCHSTPWASHLGAIPGWFLTCEPPLAGDHQQTQQDLFYDSPVSYVQQVFPYPPVPQAINTEAASDMPSHVILFGELLDRTELVNNKHVSVADALQERGYEEVIQLWNGFDVAQDEEKRRGGVRVWRKEISEKGSPAASGGE